LTQVRLQKDTGAVLLRRFIDAEVVVTAFVSHNWRKWRPARQLPLLAAQFDISIVYSMSVSLQPDGLSHQLDATVYDYEKIRW